jgi:TPR repeat protein
MHMRGIVIATLALIVLAIPAWAGFEEGKRAAMRGDYEAAYAEWRPLAEKGHADSQFLLGLMYREGRAVAQDLAESVRWLRQAAEQDHVDARFFLARALREGRGADQDYEEAAHWLRLAAEQGHADAAFTLGLMHRKGDGVTADDGEAVRWYRKAADLGHGQARFTLGAVTEEGRGVEKDLVRAYAWYTLAAESGIELGGILRDRVARQMAADEIAAAQAMIEDLRAGRPVAAAAPPPETGATTSADESQVATKVVPAPVPKPAAPPVAKAKPAEEATSKPVETAVAAVDPAAKEQREAGPMTGSDAETGQDASFRVRLAAYRTEGNLRKGWSILRSSHGDLLEKLEPSLHRVDLGAKKGVFIRLEAGPLADRAAAGALCAALKARKVDCVVVAP